MPKKPLHLMIDGVDSVGKTTVCKLLEQFFDIPVISMPKAHEYFNGDIEALSEVFNKTLVQMSRYPFIIDRGFVSSIVYSKIYGRSASRLHYLNEVYEILQPIIIILVNWDIDTLKERGDEIIPVDDFDRIQTEYVRVAHRNNYPIVDVSDKSPLEVRNSVISMAKLWINT